MNEILVGCLSPLIRGGEVSEKLIEFPNNKKIVVGHV